ncbi:MAG: sigma factor-like helix-turn-helix DNA-binding protein [Sulfuriferula sp.]
MYDKERIGELSIAFLAVLERLAPKERAAFLRHDIFDFAYPDIAQMFGKLEAGCKQMIHRARLRVRQDRPRFEVNRETYLLSLEKFIEAARTGDH